MNAFMRAQPSSPNCLFFKTFFIMLFIYLFIYCCAGSTLWHLQKVLQCILVVHPLHHSPLSSLSHSWNSFNRSHCSIYIHEYIILLPYSPFYTLSLYLPPSHWYEPPDRNCFKPPVLHFCKKKKKKTFLFV
jgi:hypothetical protein